VPSWYPENAKSLNSRVSSAVEQRFCKPLVGSSILSPGTNKFKALPGHIWQLLMQGSLLLKNHSQWR
jgi:hypothetical protein